jgi:hypothetical protein
MQRDTAVVDHDFGFSNCQAAYLARHLSGARFEPLAA